MHTIVGGCETILVFVPGRRAGEHEVDEDAADVHVTKGPSIDGQGAGRPPDESDCSADEGVCEVADAVGDPSHDIEHDMLVGGQDVA